MKSLDLICPALLESVFIKPIEGGNKRERERERERERREREKGN